MEVFDCYDLKPSRKDVFSKSIYPLDSRILLVPLDEEGLKCWLKFEEIARWRRKHIDMMREVGLLEVHDSKKGGCSKCGKFSVEVDHPFVPFVSDFAVAAFNEICGMYVKKGVEDNIYEAQVVEVKYGLNRDGYSFFVTLEAMEENVAGVYEATVLCYPDDGRQTLMKFIRSSCPPVGMKFKRMAELARETAMYEAVIEQKKVMKVELQIRCNAIKAGKKRSRESADFMCLKKNYKALKGACRMFDQHAHLLKRIHWKIKISNPDDWFIPNMNTGLQQRSAEHSCGGYDYYNPLTVFSCYAGYAS